jgi:hypothetical protein
MSEHQLSKETAAARVLKAALMEVTDDPDTLADTIEGATNLHEAIAAVMDGIGEDDMLCAGLSNMMQALSQRKSRLESRIDRRRVAIERAMAAGELTKLELPQATLSLRRVPPALHIVSETLIPTNFWQPQPPGSTRKRLRRR